MSLSQVLYSGLIDRIVVYAALALFQPYNRDIVIGIVKNDTWWYMVVALWIMKIKLQMHFF